MPRFSRHDYLFLAARLREDLRAANSTLSGDARAQAITSIYAWAQALAEDNPKGFNRELFLSNCGITQQPVEIVPNP